MKSEQFEEFSSRETAESTVESDIEFVVTILRYVTVA